MPVYKRKIKNKVKYFARINYIDIYGNYKTKRSKDFDTKKDAQIEETRLLLKNNRETKNSMTFNEAFKEFLAHQEEVVKPTTLRKYSPLFKHVKSEIGNIKIDALTVQKYKQIKNKINSNLTLEYKNKIHHLLKQIVNYTDKMYNITTNVFDKVGNFVSPGEIKKEMQFFTYEEFLKFIVYFENDIVFKSFFTLLYFQGLRLGEANALTWEEINFKDNTIKINKTVTSKVTGIDYYISSPKTKSSIRTIPIDTEVSSVLKDLKYYYTSFNRFSEKWFVFGGVRPLSETTITNNKNSACKTQKLKQIRIHDFRHSCASYYINLGAQPILISKLLGHSNISITLDTYSHLYPNKIEEIMILSDKFKKIHA